MCEKKAEAKMEDPRVSKMTAVASFSKQIRNDFVTKRPSFVKAPTLDKKLVENEAAEAKMRKRTS